MAVSQQPHDRKQGRREGEFHLKVEKSLFWKASPCFDVLKLGQYLKEKDKREEKGEKILFSEQLRTPGSSHCSMMKICEGARGGRVPQV